MWCTWRNVTSPTIGSCWLYVFAFLFDKRKEKKEQNKYLLYDYIRRICFSTRTPIIFGLDSNFAYLLCDCAPFFARWAFVAVYGGFVIRTFIPKSYHINHIHRFFIIINLCFIALISITVWARLDSHMRFFLSSTVNVWFSLICQSNDVSCKSIAKNGEKQSKQKGI